MNDLISRQAAIDALADYIHNVDKVCGTGKLSASDCRDAAHSVIDDLPSAQPEHVRHGKWMEIIEVNELGDAYQSGVYCSECGHTDSYEPNYCPNCGARMDAE